ncbi:4-diphosphocytidyl-2-C-methyl-D-erythritol kinase [Tranquillimonas rosea]|uniref:4-diphosphocytidyl-2-C-methyl-D-erythritol kinase n=1 Tax=Tranquillimonas rosea TaxID=641238 RepID=A0A1H9R586_9RHOB|nr:4-(cytidine 5'-diphospho)-2-C-methyl-D-erythritol kinase [Tranquillimonas rosea]SER67858.1 4-diphosphocytidyl-2-C-methyl-D-erythritol kinase [Tranquillimonas rosea]
MAVEAAAPAKVNLTLHVTGRRADGYHLLDSLVVFADAADRVTVEPAEAWSLTVSGPMAASVPGGDDNLVLRAARMTEGPPARISLDKRLPVAAGIGGGSADAAAVLTALHRLDGRAIPDDVVTLGADVPVCLHGRPTRMSGIGETQAEVPDLPGCALVLVNPGVPVPTPAVFAALTRRENPPMPEDLPHWRDAETFARWLSTQRNDLEDVARMEAPAVGVALSRLQATDGCLLSRMSGSGATCFGLYADSVQANAAAAELAALHPDWWIVAALPLRAPG